VARGVGWRCRGTAGHPRNGPSLAVTAGPIGPAVSLRCAEPLGTRGENHAQTSSFGAPDENDTGRRAAVARPRDPRGPRHLRRAEGARSRGGPSRRCRAPLARAIASGLARASGRDGGVARAPCRSPVGRRRHDRRGRAGSSACAARSGPGHGVSRRAGPRFDVGRVARASRGPPARPRQRVARGADAEPGSQMSSQVGCPRQVRCTCIVPCNGGSRYEPTSDSFHAGDGGVSTVTAAEVRSSSPRRGQVARPGAGRARRETQR
jgi:hypothetical protein